MDRLRTPLLAVAVLLVAFFAFERFTSGGEAEPVEDAVETIRGGATVVDVRAASEYAGGHVEGALHANVLDGGFRDAVADLDRGAPVYLYCQSGRRSGRAASVLEDMGFERVVNAGGIGDLERAGLPVVR